MEGVCYVKLHSLSCYIINEPESSYSAVRQWIVQKPLTLMTERGPVVGNGNLYQCADHINVCFECVVVSDVSQVVLRVLKQGMQISLSQEHFLDLTDSIICELALS